MTNSKKFTTMDEYFENFSGKTREILDEIRATIRKAAPDAEEVISYQMPCFKFNGTYLVYFGAWKEHIGFYATPGGNEAFKKELAPYKQAKGSVHFPYDEPIPYDLITKIVKFRMQESLEKGYGKK